MSKSKQMPEMNLRDFLKQNVAVFKDFSEDRLQELVNGARLVSFEANEAVAHAGEEVTHFSVVTSGTVCASMVGEGGAQQELGRLKTGDTFGELALMTG